MADMRALRTYIDGIKGERTATSGITGVTSNVQLQTEQLRRSFAEWYIQPKNQQAKQHFAEQLQLACTFGVITTTELANCEQLLED